jgi:hypothetical protein
LAVDESPGGGDAGLFPGSDNENDVHPGIKLESASLTFRLWRTSAAFPIKFSCGHLLRFLGLCNQHSTLR